TPTLSTCFLAFNTHRDALRDRGVREQIRDALPIATLVDRLGTLAIPATRLFPPGLFGHESARPRPPRSASDTHTMLREPLLAGVFSVFSSSFFGFAREAVAAIEGAGVRVRLVVPEVKQIAGAGNASSFDLYFARFYSDYPEIDGFAYGFLHSRSGILGPICGTAEMDELIERGRAETNPVIRREIYRDLERYVDEHALVVPLFHQQAFCFARPEVESFSVRRFFPTIPYEQLSLKR
ncbi:MAG TPA: hypothetical protein VJZ00_17625, partial [Thermoanaerobaculia bacterium]|nr:hypothetical protein [Thermoanaerobaculia bacterium]